MRIARSLVCSVLAAALVGVVVAPQAPPAAAAVSVTLSASVVPEARTYAADAYADRWDFSTSRTCRWWTATG
jgi:hypothetical protein